MTPSTALLQLWAARDVMLAGAPHSCPLVVEAQANFDLAIYEAARKAHLGITPGSCSYCSRTSSCTAANCPLTGN